MSEKANFPEDPSQPVKQTEWSFEEPVNVKAAARFLGVSPSLVYSWVERRQIPHFRMMGRSIRFRLSELDEWRNRFHVSGESNDQ